MLDCVGSWCVAGLLAAAGAQESSVPDDLAPVRAALAAFDAGPGAAGVVVVRQGEEPFVAVAGELEGGVALDADAAVALDAASRWVGVTLVGALAGANGWDLREPIQDYVPGGLPAGLRRSTWAMYCRGAVRSKSLYYRGLRAGEARRDAAAVVAAHGFTNRLAMRNPVRAAEFDDLPWAVLEYAVGDRTRQPVSRWLDAALEVIGTRGIAILEGGALPTVRWRRVEDAWEPTEYLPREAVLAGGLQATPGALGDVLEWILAAPEERAIGLQPYEDARREATYLLAEPGEHETLSEYSVGIYPQRGTAWFAWTSQEPGSSSWYRLDNALRDALVRPMRTRETGWRSAFGLGSEPPPGTRFEPLGELRGAVEHLGERYALHVDLRRSPGVFRVGETIGIAKRVYYGALAAATLEDGVELELRLRVRRSEAEGVAIFRRGADYRLPYRVRLERLSLDGSSGAPADELPWAGRSFAAAAAELGAAIGVDSSDPKPRLLIAVRSDGTRWIAAAGCVDAAGGEPFTADMRIPLGTSTREFTSVALAVLEAADRLPRDARLQDLPRESEAPYGPEIAALELADLARGRSPMPEAHRFGVDSSAARPLAAILRAHAFVPRETPWRWIGSALPRAALEEALVEADVIPSWPTFVAEELALALFMPSLRDVRDVGADFERLRMLDDSGKPVPIPVAEVGSDGNLWANAADLALWTAARLAAARRPRAGAEAEPWGDFGSSALHASGVTMRFSCNQGPGPRLAQVLLPDLDLGFVLFLGTTGASDLEHAMAAVLRAFWPVPSLDTWTQHFRTTPIPGPSRWSSGPPLGAPGTLAARVEAIGELELRLTTESPFAEVALDGRVLPIVAGRTTERRIDLVCGLGSGAEHDGELAVSVVLDDGRWVGVVEVRDGRWRREPYPLEPRAR